MLKDRKILALMLIGLLFIVSAAGFSISSVYRKSQEKAVESSISLEGPMENEADIKNESSEMAVTNESSTPSPAAKTKIASRGTISTSKSTQVKSKSATQPTAKSVQATASSRKATALDWWSEAQYVFPRNAVAKVTDVYTGKVFNIKRTYGTNHADCEALTAKDSEIIKSIWGGWSWVRRPVVVEVNGKRIAASMAAMPHAGLDRFPALQTVDGRSGGYGTGQNLDAVKGNGMDGHFDVHFLNSRTHGTNKVDPQHQAAIKAAVGH